MPNAIIESGIEYNGYPPPNILVKAMERPRALALINDGNIRFRTLSYYREIENPGQGDPNEGIGNYQLNGNDMTTTSANEIFIWCTSLDEVSRDTLLRLATGYETIIRIQNPLEFFSRIYNFLRENLTTFHLHCGRVIYNRGQAVDQQTLNEQKWHYNIFQKDTKYADQMEYRISLTNVSFGLIAKDYIDLNIRYCQDIISIE